MPTRFFLLVLVGSSMLVPACSSGESVEDAIVKAVSVESEAVQARERLQAKAAEEARAKKQAADAKAKARTQAVDAAAVAPPELPEDLATACEAVVTAYDDFMKSGAEKDALLWSDGRRHKMGERRAACLKIGDLAIAACEAHALAHAPAEVQDMPRKEAGLLLMERCHDKFGAAPSARP